MERPPGGTFDFLAPKMDVNHQTWTKRAFAKGFWMILDCFLDTFSISWLPCGILELPSSPCSFASLCFFWQGVKAAFQRQEENEQLRAKCEEVDLEALHVSLRGVA